jgi:calcineurin-like phosphoesterase family protein
MPETWYTSDPHFDHRNIIKYCDRPYLDVDHMNEMLIVNHNALVAPDDVVYITGDFSLSVNALRFVHRLNGHLIILGGNHDKFWAGNGAKHQKFILPYHSAGFAQVWPVGYDEHHTLTDGTRVADVHLCHFPFQGDSHDGDRFDKWRPVDDGRIVVHGHVHDAWKVNGRQINVGVDVWEYKPVHSSQILDITQTIGE